MSVAQELARELREARQRTLDLLADLNTEQLLGPRLDIVNPPLWEVGHVGWFQEFWVLRHLYGRSPLDSAADGLYNSMEVAHDTRWDIPLLSLEETIRYLQAVLDRVVEELAVREPDESSVYFHRLALFHEDMHTEAFTYTRQTLGYPAPGFSRTTGGEAPADRKPVPGQDVVVPGETYLLGATRDIPFVFDNEKWAHPVELEPFGMAPAPVTNGEFAAFVDDGGYGRAEFWSAEGWSWRRKEGADHPVYWMRDAAGSWLRRHFDRWLPLAGDEPVIHVCWYEAEAYCRWAGRRLPTEAEWEAAASGGQKKLLYPWGNQPPDARRGALDWRTPGCVSVEAFPAGESASGLRHLIGNVWEWTSSGFLPYPGFERDPYKEYSEPWFGDHKVLRGGCWATRSRMIRNTWRNFYRPHRRDVLAGFRTCSLEVP